MEQRAVLATCLARVLGAFHKLCLQCSQQPSEIVTIIIGILPMGIPRHSEGSPPEVPRGPWQSRAPLRLPGSRVRLFAPARNLPRAYAAGRGLPLGCLTRAEKRRQFQGPGHPTGGQHTKAASGRTGRGRLPLNGVPAWRDQWVRRSFSRAAKAVQGKEKDAKAHQQGHVGPLQGLSQQKLRGVSRAWW